MTDEQKDQAEDVTLDMSKVDELAADYMDDFLAFLKPLRSTSVSWVKAGEQFRDQMIAERYLAWAWKNRRVILTAQFSETARRLALNERRAVARGTATPDDVAGVVADLEQRTTKRAERVAAARHALTGRLSEHFVVPGKGAMPVGIMMSDDLKAAAATLEDQSKASLRKARFLRRLAKGLPAGVKVVDHYSSDQVDAMWSTFAALTN